MKPIVFFDIETTGVNVNTDRIIELAAIKVKDLSASKFQKIHCHCNPGIPVPQSATDAHGFTDKLVKKFFLFKEYAPGVFKFIDGCDIGGYNSNKFDIPLLYNELYRCGINWDLSDVHCIDVFSIFKNFEGRSLSDAVKFYCQREHIGAHGALSDVEATVDVYKKQMENYSKLVSMSRKDLEEFCFNGKKPVDLGGAFEKNDSGSLIFRFGKCKGEKLIDNVPYLNWMLSADFHSHTKFVIKEFLESLKNI